MAKISHAYEGAVSYHLLKEASAKEINILLDAINEIRAEQEKAIKSPSQNQTQIGL